MVHHLNPVPLLRKPHCSDLLSRPQAQLSEDSHNTQHTDPRLLDRCHRLLRPTRHRVRYLCPHCWATDQDRLDGHQADYIRSFRAGFNKLRCYRTFFEHCQFNHDRGIHGYCVAGVEYHLCEGCPSWLYCCLLRQWQGEAAEWDRGTKPVGKTWR